MINLIDQFYESNDRFPRSWGDYAFTDIGLDPLEWSVGYNGIIYTPSGNRLGIKPAEGFYFVVVDANGEERELSYKLQWSLWYDMQEGKWFYHVIDKANEIDINTLRVYPQ